MSVLLLLLFSLLFSWSDFSVSSANSSITLPLSRVAPPPSTNTGNLARVHHLKYPNTRIPLYPDSSGYFVKLSFGKPPQTLRLNMDTGSSLVWFPCTHDNYTGTHGNISKVDPTFIPENSSSYKEVTFNSPECGWLFGPDRKCKNPTGPCMYTIQYMLGSTTGLLVSESLTIPGLSVANFIAGCSVASDQMWEGKVGFGRSPMSLPSQLGLKAFSHCMVPQESYDNTTASSDLVLITTWDGAKRPSGKIQYTPFVSNPTVYDEYYYVSLQKIIIGGVHVKVPANYLAVDAKGNRGTIVDSGSTYTLMEKPVFDLVFKEVIRQVGNNYSRASNIEQENDLEPCYNVGVDHEIKLPQLTFHFQGGAEMVLPLANYFSYFNNDVVCMTIQNSGEDDLGPAITLGNYQQQDYYMEYDLENNRLGILQHECKST